MTNRPSTTLIVGLSLCLSVPCLADQIVIPKYDEALLEAEFHKFMASLYYMRITQDYPITVRELLSADIEKQLQAVKTLGETGEPEVIPWMLPFLEVEDSRLRIRTGSSLSRLVEQYVLKRRDLSRDGVLIKPLRPQDMDLRPLAWVVLKMFGRRDDGNTHAYAARMTRYLSLHEFEHELRRCTESNHPSVTRAATWAIESLTRQRHYDNEISGQAAKNDPNLLSVEARNTVWTLHALRGAVALFRADNGRYPTQQEGLLALVERPAGLERWRPEGYWATKTLPMDGWGNPIVYQFYPERGQPVAVVSYGADGEQGGTGDAADISSTEDYLYRPLGEIERPRATP